MLNIYVDFFIKVLYYKIEGDSIMYAIVDFDKKVVETLSNGKKKKSYKRQSRLVLGEYGDTHSEMSAKAKSVAKKLNGKIFYIGKFAN